MDIRFTITESEAALLQVGITERGIELAGLSSDRRVTFEGAFGDISFSVIPADAAQPAPVLEHTADDIPAEGICAAAQAVEAEVVPAIQPEAQPDVQVSGIADTKPEQPQQDAEQLLFEQLAALRRQIASEERLPPYIIFHDKTLHDMCRIRPSDLHSLKAIQGVGQAKLDKYGSRFLEAIREFMEEGAA